MPSSGDCAASGGEMCLVNPHIELDGAVESSRRRCSMESSLRIHPMESSLPDKILQKLPLVTEPSVGDCTASGGELCLVNPQVGGSMESSREIQPMESSLADKSPPKSPMETKEASRTMESSVFSLMMESSRLLESSQRKTRRRESSKIAEKKKMYMANKKPKKLKSLKSIQARESSLWVLKKEHLEPSDHLSDHHGIPADVRVHGKGSLLPVSDGIGPKNLDEPHFGPSLQEDGMESSQRD